MRVRLTERNTGCYKNSIKYFFDKGVYLMLILIAPSLLLPFLISTSSTLYYLFDYQTINPTSIWDMFVTIMELPYSFWYLGIIGFVLLVLCVAIIYGVIDRHMRLGEFTIAPDKLKTRLNFNILSALRCCLLTFLAFEIFNVLTTILYYLWWVMFDSRVTWLVFSIFTQILGQLAMFYLSALTILWCPYSLHTGLKSKDALRQAISSMSGRLMRTKFMLMLVVLPVEICMIVTGALHCGVVAEVLLDAIAYLYIVPFYFVLSYNIFYDVTGTERMDLVKKEKSAR